jgi:hypothetical protein
MRSEVSPPGFVFPAWRLCGRSTAPIFFSLGGETGNPVLPFQGAGCYRTVVRRALPRADAGWPLRPGQKSESAKPPTPWGPPVPSRPRRSCLGQAGNVWGPVSSISVRKPYCDGNKPIGESHLCRDLEDRLEARPLRLNLRYTNCCETVFGRSEPQRIAERFSLVEANVPRQLLPRWRREKLSSRLPRKIERLSNLPQRVTRFLRAAFKKFQKWP